jgi:uncharacterized protein (TIGR00369 family)
MPDPIWTADEIAADLSRSPFNAALELSIERYDPSAGELVVRVPFRPEYERMAGSKQWHGGPIASIIDTVGAYVAAAAVARTIPTIDLRIDYLRPAIDTDLLVTSKIRRLGRSVAVVDIDVANGKGALVACGRGVYSTAAPTEAK